MLDLQVLALAVLEDAEEDPADLEEDCLRSLGFILGLLLIDLHENFRREASLDGLFDFLWLGNCAILCCFSAFFLASHSHLALGFISLNFCLAFFCDFLDNARLIILILLNLLKCHSFELLLLLAAESSLFDESRFRLGNRHL